MTEALHTKSLAVSTQQGGKRKRTRHRRRRRRTRRHRRTRHRRRRRRRRRARKTRNKRIRGGANGGSQYLSAYGKGHIANPLGGSSSSGQAIINMSAHAHQQAAVHAHNTNVAAQIAAHTGTPVQHVIDLLNNPSQVAAFDQVHGHGKAHTVMSLAQQHLHQ